jgi:phage shock protein C
MIEELERLATLHQSGALTDSEFTQAKARLLNSPSQLVSFNSSQKLRRSSSDRWLGGVCGGLATYTGTEAWPWRLMFVLVLIFGGVTLLIYLLMWVFVPLED